MRRIRFLAALSVALVAAVAFAADDRIQLPGAPPLQPELVQRLWKAWEDAGKPVHSRHRRPDGRPRYLNRLVSEANPYLQLHGQNPVDWYPWGEEAFARARREKKPIFLSIGYSTCHWCHVMEEESFDNEEIARLLNRDFVCVKVDREERPDIDAVYIAAVQRLTGNSGWPLTVFLAPDGSPFYGGTYFPPDDRAGRPGMKRLLATVIASWQKQEGAATEAAESLRDALRAAGPIAGGALDEVVLRRAAVHATQLFDSTNGGFGKAPKFPQPHVVQFLLRYAQRTGDRTARHMALFTLQRMSQGGIHDLLGGGFHRYATDAAWRVPHYEKMLLDQATIASAYVEAARITRSAEYISPASETFAYVLRDLRSPQGPFYTAEDAQSEGQEGKYYLWTRAEVLQAVGPEDGPWVADFFGLADNQGPAPLSIPVPAEDFLRQRGMSTETFMKKILRVRAALLAVRGQRTRPSRDEKILAGWNGMMIAALADAGAQWNQPEYLEAAKRAATWILEHMQPNGRLHRSWVKGKLGTPGFLEDYAYLAYGLQRLFEATGEPRWLEESDRLLASMLRLFWDNEKNTLRFTASDHERLVAPPWVIEDTAAPAPSSVAALALLRAGHLQQNAQYQERGRAVLVANSGDIAKAPTAYMFALLALDFALGPRQEIVVVGPPKREDTVALWKTVQQAYLPRAVLVLHDPQDRRTQALLPFLSRQPMQRGKATAYVCQNFTCKLPATDPEELSRQLAALQEPPSPSQP